MSRAFGAALVISALACSGCVQPGPAASAGDAAQSETGPAQAETGDKVVSISGPIAMVDGKRVDKIGHPFKVIPGCHVVRTDTNFVTSTNQVTVWGTMPAVDFVLNTREGYNYYVERQILDTSSQTSPVRFTAYEREASGKVVQTFAPTREASEVRACNANAPAPGEQKAR